MRRCAQSSQRSTCPPSAAVRQRSIADIAYQNKAVVYDLLLKAAAETLITIAADPKHLGARIGLTAVLHTWGSALTHHPHAHIIVPGGGFSPDGQHWIACRPGFFLPVRVLSRLFRRLFLERLTAAYQAGRLEFFADHAALAEPAAFKAYLAALRQAERVVAQPAALIRDVADVDTSHGALIATHRAKRAPPGTIVVCRRRAKTRSADRCYRHRPPRRSHRSEREFLPPRAREEQCLPADPARSALARSLRTSDL